MIVVDQFTKPLAASTLIFGFCCALLLGGCAAQPSTSNEGSGANAPEQPTEPVEDAPAGGDNSMDSTFNIQSGEQEYRGFILDNVLQSPSTGDIHYSLYVPDSYNPAVPASLFVTLPGYQGLYFQGVGENLYTEEFAFEAARYDGNMIIAAPQLNDWGETSADQTIALIEALMSEYSINPDRVFIEGYSGGGETLSLVLEKRPELFAAAAHLSSQWDGDLASVADNKTPVYIAIGEGDEYYGPGSAEKAAEELRSIYRAQGMSESEIDGLVVLDIKPRSYFSERGATSQHGSGNHLFAEDETIMGWLFDR